MTKQVSEEAVKRHQHEWVVFSSALQEHWLMLQCVECGVMGTVEDPSAYEWKRAGKASMRPFRWSDDKRVVVRETASLYIVRSGKWPQCKCGRRSFNHEVPQFERFPREIIRRNYAISPEEQNDLLELAKAVDDSDLCSRLFPTFVRSYREHTGAEVTGAAVRVARLIEQIDAKGIHCTPFVVALVLREFAGPAADPDVCTA